MDEFWQNLLWQPIRTVWERLCAHLPELFAAFLLLAGGLVLASILGRLFRFIFRRMKVDELAERYDIGRMVKKTGVADTVSTLLGRLVYWLILAGFVVLSASSLRLPATDRILERFVLYLPNLFLAFLILLLGYVVGNFLSRAVLIAGVNSGLAAAKAAARWVKYAILLFTLAVTAEQLGVGKGTVLLAFGILFGGVVLALSLAFGLGGKDLAKDFLEKTIRESKERDDIDHF